MNKKLKIIRQGECKCGCGGKTKQTKYANPARGYIAGDYMQFIKGHQNRMSFLYNEDKTKKRCTKCSNYLSLDNFKKSKKSRDGLTFDCKKCIRIRDKEYNKLHIEKIKEYGKSWHLKRAYGLKKEDYEEKMKKQGNKCLICKILFLKTKRGGMVDHNHKTKEIRGILCDGCNKGLGYFKENKETLLNAIKYIEKYE